MKLLRRIWSHMQVLAQARRNRTDLLRWLGRRPQLALGVATYETALLASGRADSKLKLLASGKAAAMVNCEFCMDIGAAIGRSEGLTEQELLDLPSYRESDAYDDLEKLVIEFAAAMTASPAIVPDELRDQLLHHLSRTQLAELATEVAWENHRGRLNQALGVRPAGFSDGATCLIAEPAASTSP